MPSMLQNRARIVSFLILAAFIMLVIVIMMWGQRLLDDFSNSAQDTPFAGLFPERDPFHAEAINDPPFESLSYGVQTFLWWDDGWSAGKNMDWVLMMQFTHVKQIFAWEDLEIEPGVWAWDNADFIVNELESRDLKIIARLGHTPDWAHPDLPTRGEGYVDSPPDDLTLWANYCRTLAERYQGRIKAYQIWNEPNLTREWGNQPPNAAEYVELLSICSNAIREVDPAAIIISAGLAPTGDQNDRAHRDDIYLREMYENDFQQYVDVVGVHAPGFSAPSYGPDDAEADGLQRWQSFRRPEDLRKIMIEYDDAHRQMAILEMGYTTNMQDPVYSWFAVTEEEQAEYIKEAYLYAAENWRPWVGLMTLIYIADPRWTPEQEEYWFAIDAPHPSEPRNRPAFNTIVQMEKYCGNIVLPARSPEETTGVPDEPNPCS